MDAYFDSGIIVKLYVKETNSLNAISLVGRYTAPHCLTHWQALEVKNAIRLKAFRNEISTEEMALSIRAFDQDIAAGRWQFPAYSTLAVEQRADELSASYSAILGCRSLDIIHVAAALILGAKQFVTFDQRQASMAKHVGLTVVS